MATAIRRRVIFLRSGQQPPSNLAIANNPLSRRALQPNGRVRLEGEQNSIKIRVLVNTADQVWTAHPIDGYSIP